MARLVVDNLHGRFLENCRVTEDIGALSDSTIHRRGGVAAAVAMREATSAAMHWPWTAALREVELRMHARVCISTDCMQPRGPCKMNQWSLHPGGSKETSLQLARKKISMVGFLGFMTRT